MILLLQQPSSKVSQDTPSLHPPLAVPEGPVSTKTLRCNCAIDILPVELIMEIFVTATQSADAEDSRRQQGGKIMTWTASIISHVCSYWRAIALSTCEMWSSFSLFLWLGRGSIHGAKVIDLYLARSQGYPLAFHITSFTYGDVPQGYRDITIRLARESHRWKRASFNIMGPGTMNGLPFLDAAMPDGQEVIPVPNLQKLELPIMKGTYRPLFDTMDALQTFSYAGEGLPESLELPWEQIRHSTLYKGATFLRSIQKCPSLRRIDLIPYGCDLPPRSDPPEEYIHEELEQLLVDTSHTYDAFKAGPLMELVSFPKLRELTVISKASRDSLPLQDIVNFITRSNCSLESLSLRNVAVDAGVLTNLLDRLHTLTSLFLDVSDTDASWALIRFLSTTTTPSDTTEDHTPALHLPHLRFLSMAIIPFMSNALLRTVEFRRQKSSNLAKLVVLLKHEYDLGTSKLRLSVVKNSGVELEVRHRV